METDRRPIVAGWRWAAVRTALWARIGWLALRRHGTPLHAARVVRALATLRPGQEPRPRKFARAGGRYFWFLYVPGFPSRAFDRFVAGEMERVLHGDRLRPLQTAIVAITKRCPLRCDHCCEWPALNRPEMVSVEQLSAIVTRLARQGVAQVFFSGGEPLQRFPELVALVQTVGGDADSWILTSGLGLTAERARALRRAGLTGVALSLDHWDAAVHDRLRGLSGSHAALGAAARAARDAGLLVALSLCPRPGLMSDQDLDRYAEEARRLGAGIIQILEPRAVGRYEGRHVDLSAEEVQALEWFQRRVNHDPRRRDQPVVSYVAAAQRRSRCGGAGERYVYVDTDAEVHACPFCRESAGSALAADFDAVLASLRRRGCPQEACRAGVQEEL